MSDSQLDTGLLAMVMLVSELSCCVTFRQDTPCCLSSPSSLKVGTFHKLLGVILRSYPGGSSNTPSELVITSLFEEDPPCLGWGGGGY